MKTVHKYAYIDNDGSFTAACKNHKINQRYNLIKTILKK